ncbi:MAG: aminodeoxychorismate synthase, component I, partial [Pseudomonadota bacterium]|nr:aminodeoxychorismate synthase, component I [Pseudomonadota bacterium]
MLVTRPLPAEIDLLDLHRRAPARYPLLLESAAHGTAQGRWDLLMACNGESLSLDAAGIVRRHDGSIRGNDFLSALDAEWRQHRIAGVEPRWPFRGGWALFLAYELAAQVEPILPLPKATGALPVALALRCPAAVLRDHATGECIAIAETDYATMLDDILIDIDAVNESNVSQTWHPPYAIEEDDPEQFTTGVTRILDYLSAGDVFQVNLSRGWRARF